ncbi:MAG TPA: CDP-glucose 4,6-dehydratase [Chitinophagaceae bacterium]
MENLGMSASLQSYYRDKKVFVTGHTGFKGSWLTATLNKLGATVKGYALAPLYAGGLFELITARIDCENVEADIRDLARLQSELLSFQPDYIFHLAAQPLVRESYEFPIETFQTNIIGTANLLQAARTLRQPCAIVVITTDKVYENQERDVLYQEHDKLGGHDPYSASKACAEIVTHSFARSFHDDDHPRKIATARAGNVIGGGDWSKDRIMPDIIRALEQHKMIEVRHPGAVRPWQHVLEPVGGYLRLAGLLATNAPGISSAYNFGPEPGDHLTVRDFVESSIACWGGGEWKDVSGGKQRHEAGMLKLDIRKAAAELNWRPLLNAAQAIRWAVEWYKAPEAKRADIAFTQIADYFGL